MEDITRKEGHTKSERNNERGWIIEVREHWGELAGGKLREMEEGLTRTTIKDSRKTYNTWSVYDNGNTGRILDQLEKIEYCKEDRTIVEEGVT